MSLPTTLWIVLGTQWTAAAVFTLLGVVLLRRSVADDAARFASVMFALWWFGLGVSKFVAGLRIALQVPDVPLSLLVGLSFVSSSAVAIGLAGLLCHLIYLFTGRTALLWPVIGFYALLCGWIISSSSVWNPVGVEISAWGAEFAYAQPYTMAYRLVVLLVIVGPQVLAVAALFVMAARLPSSAGRFRTIVVAASVAIYIVDALIAPAYPADSAIWQIVHHMIPIGVGLGVLAVYRPPRWLRGRMPPELSATALREAAGA
ncbi:MAG: hypothetical protein H0U69_04655 [Trueperaceae bacterium]|nr:hypothetical protein [Trueperaceae bacterium]